MKYKVLTNHWKHDLYKDDIIPDTMYSKAVLERAKNNQYIENYQEAAPTGSSYKADIQAYLDSKGIEYTSDMTKSELLELI